MYQVSTQLAFTQVGRQSTANVDVHLCEARIITNNRVVEIVIARRIVGWLFHAAQVEVVEAASPIEQIRR